MAQKVKVGIYRTVWGISSFDVPDGIPKEEIPNYLKDHINEIPSPDAVEYVGDSDEIDMESIMLVN